MNEELTTALPLPPLADDVALPQRSCAFRCYGRPVAVVALSVVSCVLGAVALRALHTPSSQAEHPGRARGLRVVAAFPKASQEFLAGEDSAAERLEVVDAVDEGASAEFASIGVGVARNATHRRLNRDQDEVVWLKASRDGGFGPRYAHAAVINHAQKIFVVGGTSASDSSTFLNDVWVSSDLGQSFSLVTPRPPNRPRFHVRRGHSLVLSNNGVAMFLAGGFCGKACFLNDLWSSVDGGTWNFLGKAPWSGRHGHAAAYTSKDALVVVGGHDGQNYLNDVWVIQDPAQAMIYSIWRNVAKQASWAPRMGHALVINSLDVLTVLGGFFANKQTGQVGCYNDVWRSHNVGASWELVTRNAAWSPRYEHTAEVNHLGQMFVLGGLTSWLERCSDAWRSKNGGLTWTNVSPNAPWAARYEHSTVVDKEGGIYMIGGMSTNTDTYSDVWRSVRTCADNITCPDLTVCRDGTDHNFDGITNPICVDNCDRRIYDKCGAKEACHVRDKMQTCFDPCDEKSCGDGYVCEVEARGAKWQGKILDAARPYCLSCGGAHTKYACDKLKQFDWSGKHERCDMRCRVNPNAHKCNSLDYCQWKEEECIQG